uniref:Alginate export domain-containing protein n=1 Tax=Candidatus Kentrum sp. TUN TaxID=2126343 RepID=A0A450ZHZ5_9GAMM|nr:MAG: hypothetical protein BECKTUN1418F_GA0071002_10148 [Candidatus Kentron sp. TUN]VFK53443.1 MAG: hypothetical protein BECKTUN1418E_GA0071001_10168 [Candidatus Kentron sp. TUN]
MPRALFIGLLLLAAISSPAGQFTGTLWVAPAYYDANPDALFFIPGPFDEFKNYGSRQEFEAGYRQGGFNVLATAIHNLREGTKPESDEIVNELYYDAQIAGQEISFGKKIMSWGVGYGFRPLDVVQREDRRRLFLRTLEGVKFVAGDYFTDDSAFTLAYINSDRGQDDDRIDEESLALKYYRLQDNTDIHAVARLSGRSGIEAGVGFSHVVNEGLEGHGSILYQNRYNKRINRLTESGSPLLATGNPIQERSFRNGVKALLGATWTHASGISLLGEFWFDNAAYSGNEWDDLRQLTWSQLGLLGTGQDGAVYSNIGASTEFLSQSNLLQQNLLLRISHDSQDAIDSALDLLYTPEDRGWTLTAALTHERDNQNFELGLRIFGGHPDSAYHAIPTSSTVYLTWQFAFGF